jgi:hypothetical protein
MLCTATLSLSLPAKNELQLQFRRERQFRKGGTIAGGTLVTAGATLGTAVGIFDPTIILASMAAIASVAVVNTVSHNEDREPLDESQLEVKESEIPGAGMGMFARTNIPEGTYLMEYRGERFSESDYFERYPDGQGRYVAEIEGFFPWNEATYLDAVDATKTNLARYMNSQEDANVVWKKQRVGPQAGKMFMYSSRDVCAGEELCFDYGEQYWDAVVE